MRAIAGLAAFTALSTIVVAAIGVFGRGKGESELVTSVRGETFSMIVSGVYAFNAERIVAEGVGWDIFTLFVASPALLICVPAILRNSFRGRLVAAGLSAYVFYQYFMYALTWAFGPLLLPFITLAVLGLVGLVRLVTSLVGEPLEERFRDEFPRRGVAALCFVMSAILVVMWMTRIGAALSRAGSPALLGQTTMVVQVLDLVLLVPFATLTGVLALRRRPVGYVLASIFLTKALAMAAAICAMLVMAWRVEGRLELAPLTLFGAAAIAATLLGLRVLRNTREAPLA